MGCLEDGRVFVYFCNLIEIRQLRFRFKYPGMLLEIKGEFPTLHEKVTYHNYEFEVLEMDSRRILKVKFTILQKEMEDGVVSAV